MPLLRSLNYIFHKQFYEAMIPPELARVALFVKNVIGIAMILNTN